MAFNKKKKRRITVGNQLFFWRATGDDGYITLMVMAEIEGSGKVFANFDYHQDVERFEVDGKWSHSTLSNQFVITPFIVRQVIELALREGWNPQEKSANLRLGPLDDKIDLRLDQNRANCFKQSA